MLHTNSWTLPQVVFSENLTKSQNYEAVLTKLREKGIVRICPGSMDKKVFVEFTKFFGTCITLPAFLSPSKCQGYPEIARVANFSENSDHVDVKYAFGSYWHHDGDFWGSNQHRIINILYAQVCPESGGKTGFLDTQKAFEALPVEIRTILEKLVITVDPKNIEDFRNVSDEDSSFLKGSVSEHHVVQEDANHVKSLYVPFFEGTIGTTVKYTYLELMEFVDKPEFKYLHQWETDEMILWDNTKFMHRAMGETVGKRLLWRTQARMI